MPKDNVDLHRLVWSPDDFDGDRLLPSAFRRQDLDGAEENYISVSRVDQINPKAEIEIAEVQSNKAGNSEVKREQSFSVLLNCGDLRNSKSSDDVHPFNITSEPIAGVNEAHCGIRNMTGKSSRGYINELRSILVGLVRTRQTLDQFLKQFQ